MRQSRLGYKAGREGEAFSPHALAPDPLLSNPRSVSDRGPVSPSWVPEALSHHPGGPGSPVSTDVRKASSLPAMAGGIVSRAEVFAGFGISGNKLGTFD